jgi:hypothetical protein
LGDRIFKLRLMPDLIARLWLRRPVVVTAGELAALRAFRSESEQTERDGVDAAGVIRELSRLAGEELPRVAAEACQLLEKNAALTRRADQAEREASALAAAVLFGTDDDRGEDPHER